jgi:hypothetical protein
MKGSRFYRFFRVQLIGMTSVFLASCGMISTQGTSVSCPASTAIFEVYDGYIKRVCGCNESANTIFSLNQQLTCTAKIGTYFSFYFVGITQQHTMLIFDSYIYQPAAAGTQIYNAQAFQTKTYNFLDNPSGVNGTFTITP